MKYHRWENIEGGVGCKRCGVIQLKKGHITACPPTFLEKILLDSIAYGSTKQTSTFKGLLALCKEGE